MINNIILRETNWQAKNLLREGDRKGKNLTENVDNRLLIVLSALL